MPADQYFPGGSPYETGPGFEIWFAGLGQLSIKRRREKWPKKEIIVAGILDTKGEEIKFLAEWVRAAGGNATILELSVGHEVGWADISLRE